MGRSWTAPPVSSEEGERALILYVDVDDQSFDTSGPSLASSYRLLRARNDREACERIREYAQDIVAILIDIDLPGSILDGVLLTRILRRVVPEEALPKYARALPQLNVPIVFLTHKKSVSPAELRQYGGDRVLQKPADLGEVTLAITDWHLALRLDTV